MDEQELQLKVRRVSERWTDSMWVLANEPSVGLFRVQEHILRSLPELAEHKTNFLNVEERSNGIVYDVEYACGALSSIASSSLCFSSVEGLLQKAINLKEQLNSTLSASPPQRSSVLQPASVSVSNSPPDFPTAPHEPTDAGGATAPVEPCRDVTGAPSA
ncbi:BLOC-1-related complex subunit 8-like isoform X2 [Petromyzon marinus]|uniref:BLOC-1-related complex subunit 8-like n=2 Tax=Petromyzon marinus TaxID=7757 RepID=A0AAJ7UBR7_PETMA|nr:BLOC-1-related complex subunit 8-like [Petromyzon marinus]